MFFLITHIFIGKYYPNLVTQFIIGCVCYVVSFLILRDIISVEIYEQYKYYGMALIGIDTAYLVYKGKSCQNINMQSHPQIESPKEKSANIPTTESVKTIKTITDTKPAGTNIPSISVINTTGVSGAANSNHTAPSITLSSEIDDYKVVHDPEVSIAEDSIFLASENKDKKWNDDNENRDEISLVSLSQ